MSPDSPAATSSGGRTVLRDRYELGDRVGQSAFFFLHQGADLRTGRPVSLRILRGEYSADQVFTQRLLAEAQSAAALRHPGIAQVQEAWAERGTVVIASEAVKGISLEERIRRVAPFPLQVSTDICLACAEALNYAHEAGYVHGDIRPETIMITPEGRVKITDFGVGSSLASSWKSQLHALGSAAFYQSPEVLEGKPPGAQSDIYSLGCVYYEMLSGSVPFKGETPVAVAARHLQQPPPVLKRENPEIPNAVSGIVLRCMQKSPRERYSSAERLLRDLHSVREALQTGAPLNWTPMPLEPPQAAAAYPPAPRARGRTSRPTTRPEDSRPAPVGGGPSWRLLLALAVVIAGLIGGFFGLGMYITRTPDQVTLPVDLVGLPEEKAAGILRQLGLTVDIRRNHHERAPVGTVYDTNPRPGTETRAGKAVSLFVSQGVQPATVPDVVGRELSVAQREVQAAGFVLGKTQEEFSEVIPRGEVMSQVPIGGTSAGRQSPIDLTVSKGKEPIPRTQAVDVLPDDTPAEPSPTDPKPLRDMEVAFPISARATGPQRVRIVVRGEDGFEETQYDEEHRAGDQVRHTVTVQGDAGKSEIRVYLNDRLIHRENR